MHPLKNLISRSPSVLLVALMAVCSGPAAAQWQWTNAEGRKVFSDTAPPSSVPEKNIIKRPGNRVAPPPVEVGEEDAKTTEPAAVPAPVVKDEKLEAAKKKAEAEEAAKRKAELERVAKGRAENCERAKRAKATLDSGVRVAITNAKGEREILDEKGLATEGQRLDRIIQADCGPMPAQ